MEKNYEIKYPSKNISEGDMIKIVDFSDGVQSIDGHVFYDSNYMCFIFRPNVEADLFDFWDRKLGGDTNDIFRYYNKEKSTIPILFLLSETTAHIEILGNLNNIRRI